MKRAHIVRVLACVALSMAFFQPDAGAAADDDILFAPKAFFDDGVSVEISGTLTGDDLPYKNNTVVVACYRDRRECLTYSIEEIGPNQMGRLVSPIIFPITAWNAFEVTATQDASVVDCRKTMSPSLRLAPARRETHSRTAIRLRSQRLVRLQFQASGPQPGRGSRWAKKESPERAGAFKVGHMKEV
jgi:hypothetical protein